MALKSKNIKWERIGLNVCEAELRRQQGKLNLECYLLDLINCRKILIKFNVRQQSPIAALMLLVTGNWFQNLLIWSQTILLLFERSAKTRKWSD